ncbi:unnamed protein product [Clonostachys rosea]|uniref:Rhodopsin domain-containing protein n=1 Tax=Bionectria ochroleuca TaxID=29856 RepID=A0ABY6UG53_BIOOC|nr:unnamed protein product [Clonostachys rosea]
MSVFSGKGLLAVEWTLIGIALILLIARLNLRIRHLRSGFVISDFFMIAAFIAAVSLTSADTWLYHMKVYKANVDFQMNNWDASAEEKIQAYKAFFSLYFPFYVETYLNKGTLIALYFEIFGQHIGKTRSSLFALSTFCVIGLTTTVLMNLFYCRFGCYWSLDNPCDAHCVIVKDNVGWAFHFACGLLIFVLPLVYINRLNMSKTQIISTGIIFCLGFVNLCITLARCTSTCATGTRSHASAIRKEITTCQEISYLSVEEQAFFQGRVHDVFCDTRSIRTVSVNGNAV